MKYETWNMKHETWNMKHETWKHENMKHETWNMKHETQIITEWANRNENKNVRTF